MRKPNGVVSSELLEGIAAVDGLRGPTLDEFGTVGSGRCYVSEVNDGPGQEDPPTPSPGACLTMPTRCGSRVIK